jgi:hypothetical protein
MYHWPEGRGSSQRAGVGRASCVIALEIPKVEAGEKARRLGNQNVHLRSQFGPAAACTGIDGSSEIVFPLSHLDVRPDTHGGLRT